MELRDVFDIAWEHQLELCYKLHKSGDPVGAKAAADKGMEIARMSRAYGCPILMDV